MNENNDALLPVIREQQTEIVVRCKDMMIDVKSSEGAEKAGFFLTKVKGAQKDLEALRKAQTKPLDDRKKAVMDAFREPEKQLLEIEAHLKNQLLRWSDYLRIEQAKKQAELEAKAKAQQEAARAMLKAEAQKKLEEDPFSFDEVEAIEQEAETLCVPTVILPERKTIPFNSSIRENWKFEIVDETKIPRAYFIVNEKMLGELARRLKADADVPGVRFFCEKGIAARAS